MLSALLPFHGKQEEKKHGQKNTNEMNKKKILCRFKSNRLKQQIHHHREEYRYIGYMAFTKTIIQSSKTLEKENDENKKKDIFFSNDLKKATTKSKRKHASGENDSIV